MALKKQARLVWKLSTSPLARKIAITRFAKTLSTMLASGVPLLRALDIVKAILGNTVLQKVVEDAKASIQEGEKINRPRVGIGRNTRIENAIIDKNARIGDNVVISPTGKPENVFDRLAVTAPPQRIIGGIIEREV